MYDILELVILVALKVVKLINEPVGVEFIELLVELWVVLYVEELKEVFTDADVVTLI